MTKKTEKTEQAAIEQPVIDNPDNSIAPAEQSDGGAGDFVPEEIPVPAMQPADDVPTVANDNRITVVIPFFAKKNKADEVLLGIRSVCRYFDNVKFVVIGDSIEVLQYMPVEQIEYKDAEGNQSDLLEVLKLAVTSEAVSDKFILLEPGTYLIDHVQLAHIELPKHLGLLNPMRYSGTEAEQMKITADFLRQIKITPYDYNTHCPVVIEKDKLTVMFEELPDSLSGKYNPLFIYSNVFAVHPVRLDYLTDTWLLPVVSEKPDTKKVDKLITGKCFLYLKHFQNANLLTPFLDIV